MELEQLLLNLNGATMWGYLTLIPDHSDSQMIREVGINKVVHKDDLSAQYAFTVASKDNLRCLDCRYIDI